MKTLIRILAIALMFMPVAAVADDTGHAKAHGDTSKPAKKTSAKLTDAELQILAHYHMVNQLEIELGSLAMKRATDDRIQAYGAMLVRDHGDSDKKLFEIAKAHGQSIPAVKPANDVERKEIADTKADAAALKMLKGTDFDREYLRMMVQGHDKELAKVDAMLARAKSKDMIEMVKAKRPTLQKHADEARELQKSDVSASL